MGLSHSRFRFAPAALVRRWPRQVPSGFMLGTCPQHAPALALRGRIMCRLCVMTCLRPIV